MPTQPHDPRQSDEILDLKRRVRTLESLVGTIIETRMMPTPFSLSGLLEEDVESPAWTPVHSVQINLVVARVLTAPSGGDLTIDLRLYGPSTGVVRTVTVPDGLTKVEDAVPFVIPQGGSLTATVTNAAAAADLSISLVPIFI